MTNKMHNITVRATDQNALASLQASKLPPLLSQLFASRGLKNADETIATLDKLLAPNTLKNNAEMAVHLADAIVQNKQLLVIGDYDADGATATAVAVKGLRQMGAKVGFLVPNRFEYGYGLTPEIVQLAAQQKPDILITVDNGIASVDGVATANALGMQVLVTDHHLPGDTLPDAACIINPNQPDCGFASKSLAGVGVMFYGLLALRAELRTRGFFADKAEPNLTELLDLVALGTVADLVKLDANNRILVEQGLRRMRAGVACHGVSALLKVAGRDPQKANAQDLGFYAGPRLNAAGRLDDMTLGIQCLLSENAQDAWQIAQQLQALNIERRSIESDMQAEAFADLEAINVGDQFALCVYQAHWHQGVIGILASRLKAKFHRVTIVFASAGDGVLKGSGRSIANFHLRDALDLVSKRHPSLIQKFGGHAMAAGLTILEQDFVAFEQAFESVARELLNPADLDEIIETDGSLNDADMQLETAQMLQAQVWGQGFAPPLFCDEFKVLKQNILSEKHLKLTVLKNQMQFQAIFFGQATLVPEHIRAVYALQTNEFRGDTTLQLQFSYVEAV